MGALFSGSRKVISKVFKDKKPLGLQAAQKFKDKGGAKSLLSSANDRRKDMVDKSESLIRGE